MNHLQEIITFGFWAPGPVEWVVIGIVAVLLFGRRLPELGRSLGRGLVEFKKGLHEVQNEITTVGEDTSNTAQANPQVKPDENPQAYEKQE